MLNSHIFNSKMLNSISTATPDPNIINSELVKNLIKNLYAFRYDPKLGESDINVLINKFKWSEAELRRAINHLEALNWIRCYNVSGKYTMTGLGSLKSEESGTVDRSVAIENSKTRSEILKFLAKKYEITTRLDNYSRDDFSKEYNKPFHEVAAYMSDLSDLGLLGTSNIRLSELGYQSFQLEKKWEEIEDEYQIIAKLPPQKRGLEFEKLLGVVIALDGWNVDHSVRNENEENDLIISKESEYYLGELKWLKSPVQAGKMRQFIVKIFNRAGVKGIYVSMSGFSSGSIAQVKEQISGSTICLFGHKDIENIFSRKKKFSELLTEKTKVLVLKKEILWE